MPGKDVTRLKKPFFPANERTLHYLSHLHTGMERNIQVLSPGRFCANAKILDDKGIHLQICQSA
jgi:hypothetical protein